MGCGGLIEDAVTFPQNFLVVTNLNAHSTLDHQIKLLSGVGGGVNRLVLQLFGILIGDPIGGRQLLAEHGCHILDGDAILAGGNQALAPAGHGITGQLRTAALQQNSNFNTKDLGALVQERKGQIYRAGFVLMVNLFGNLRLLCHFLHAVAQNLPHTSDTGCNIH